jgi:protoporphyrinogen IX oxidase
MELAFKLLLIVHLGSLVVGAATNVVMPLIGAQMAGAPPEVAARFGPIAGRLSINSRWALGLLVLTGIAMLWLRYDGDTLALGPWFIAKLVFVGVILLTLVLSLVLPRERIDLRLFGMAMRISLIGIVVCSVMAFN